MENVIDSEINDKYAIYNGDTTDVIKNLKDESVGYSIFSPPFMDLFTYSNSNRDLGNSATKNIFFQHFSFIVKELFRILKSGRLVSVHCMNIPKTMQRDGLIGIYDFRGNIIRLFEKCGFIFHSEVCIWKDPLIQAVRTKSLGLLHKQLCKDSSRSQQGLPDYIVTFRKFGVNNDLISHENGFETYDYPGEKETKQYLNVGNYSHNMWRKLASPVWMDVRQTRVLNYKSAKSENDEKHVCPLSLDVIERCLLLWSKSKDVVFTPFMGIGSEVLSAVHMKRKAIGIELKKSYFQQTKKNLKHLNEFKLTDLF